MNSTVIIPVTATIFETGGFVMPSTTDMADSNIVLDYESEDTFSIELAENTTKSNIFKDLRNFAKEIAKEIKNDPNHWYLLLSVTIAIIWAIYVILYNSRIQGQILTAFLRRFIKKGDIRIGSFSISLLWGKFIFSDIVYVTEDFSIRVVDAIIQFHYWLPYIKKKITEDMSKCEHRLWVELNGPELHIYNRSELYNNLAELFGLDPQLIPKTSKTDSEVISDKTSAKDGETPSKDMSFWSSWRDLIPVIKVDLNMARFVFGNRLIPSTLLLTMDKAECIYSTKPAACSLDFFMHVIKSKAENFRVILAPSPKYTGVLDEPPRYMGEGFVVMSSSKIQFYYYMDEAGIIPVPSENLLIHSGDDLYSPPAWGLDIRCEKGTNVSYGPWADRQREQLFKLFFPQDYQKLMFTKPQMPGEVRQATQFDIRLSILTEATIDILFTKEKETNAVYMTCQKGSYLEMTLPWTVKKEGYMIRINGQLLYLEASTSLQYRHFIETESFKYEINVKYPLIWNKHQSWHMIFHGSKVTLHFLYMHKEFFRDLIQDWASKQQPDILHFVPYTWYFSFNFKLFELITLANEYNWVDCSQQEANSKAAICGDLLDLHFNLPSVTFLPEIVPLTFLVAGKTLFLALQLPSTNTTSGIITALDTSAKFHWESNSKSMFSNPAWRKFCKKNCGWVDCWQVPQVDLTLGYTYHPMPPLGPTPQANVSTPEKMELLLSPIRAPKKKKSPLEEKIKKRFKPENFDPTSLGSDVFTVDLHIIHPSEIKLYGSIVRHFIHLKENIFGEDQKFIDMSEPSPYDTAEELSDIDALKHSILEEKEDEFDERKYRPFEVTVYIDIRNVKGHLMKDCADSEPPCATINLDCLIFEMNKQYQETQMQVVLSPLILTTFDNNSRTMSHSHLQQGFLVLSGFQMRGHAMFSDEGRTPWEETLEYGWLVELTVGSLSGRLTTPQLQHVVTGLDTFIFTAVDNENCLRPPRPYHLCYHDYPQPDCPHTLPDHYCPTVDVIKYKMLRISVDAIDFHLVEAGTDLNLQVFPIRIATCNLHGQHTRSGITAHVDSIRLKNYVCAWARNRESRHSNETEGKVGEAASTGGLSGVGLGCTSGSACTANTVGTSSMTVPQVGNNDFWIEAAAVMLGPLDIYAAVSSNILHHDMQLIQDQFLKLHDMKTKRLWFLWPQEVTNISPNVVGKCGCVGGCSFIGSNRNGPRFFQPSRQDFIEGLNVAQFRINDNGTSPGYGQSILHGDRLVFETHAYTGLTRCQYGSTLATDKEQLTLSSGYTKSATPAPACDIHASGSSSVLHPLDTSSDSGKLYLKTNQFQHKGSTSQMSQELDTHAHDVGLSTKGQPKPSKVKYTSNGVGTSRIGETSSLGRPTRENVAVMSVQSGECLTSPGSLTDLRSSSDTNNSSQNPLKMPSSLSLQTELPIQGRQHKFSLNGKPESGKDIELNHNVPTENSFDALGAFHRTVSVGSEPLSEAFYSAEEDQAQHLSRRGTSVSPTLSQISLPTVPEDYSCKDSDFVTDHRTPGHSSSSDTKGKALSPDHNKRIEQYLESGSRSRSNSSISNSSKSSSSSGNSSDSSARGICDYRNGIHGHSQTSLLHSSDSDECKIDEINVAPPVKTKTRRKSYRTKSFGDDFMSEVGSVSSNSFISAVSSQDDIAFVDLHMQLNKPITESPLLMSSYINHMTQLRCQNWDSPTPSFDKERQCCAMQTKKLAPLFEKISEGFTAIRMVDGTRYTAPPVSIPSCSNHTPSHPYSWDTPVFTWGETVTASSTTNQEDFDEGIGSSSLLDSNTTRTTVVMKLKKDVDLTISPIALESTQRFLDALTPVMESLHPLTIVNRAHFKSVSSVAGKNTLKKDRYMYWSRLRDTKKCGTPEQGPVVTSTYQESCFRQIQGEISIPRVNFTLLQASVVEEIISFSALDNIRDLTCVSLFSFCLDGVNLKFYSGHQSKQSVQIFMRNPKVPRKPKKTKYKSKHNIDLFTEPVYIETSERQQEENVISVSVHKLHVQLRRLKNESSLLKDASITAIPNHRSKVMFTYRRCSHVDEENDEDNHTPHSLPSTGGRSHSDEERMGFIMFEAGLENIALNARKRKGFCDQSDGNGKADRASSAGGSSSHATCGGKETSSQSRRDSTAPHQNSSSGAAAAAAGAAGHNKIASRTKSAPPGTVPKSGKAGSTVNPSEHPSSSNGGTQSVPATAPPTVSTPFCLRKSTPETKDAKGDSDETQHSVSPSQESSITGHSAGIPASTSTRNSVKEDTQAAGVPAKADKKDITSFAVELCTVWFNFAAPPQTPITKKIDYTRLDWNFLSTASPSINAWMNPSDQLTVSVIHFLHSSESRRLGVMASLMAEALDMQSIHVPPKNKYSKLMPLSQTIQEDPSCQLCNVLRRYVLQSSVQHLESNLTFEHLPKLATLRQGVVVLSRQWKSALYMPLLMEQTFKHRQARPTYSYKSAFHLETVPSAQSKGGESINRAYEERISLLQHDKDSPLSNIDEEMKEGIAQSDDENTDGVLSSSSSHLPSRQGLPSFPPRSSTASAILPPPRATEDSPTRKFHFPKFGNVVEETLNFFRSSQNRPCKGQLPVEGNLWQGSVPTGLPALTSPKEFVGSPAAKGDSLGSKGSQSNLSAEKQSMNSENGDMDYEPPILPQEDLYKWMAKQQEHNMQNFEVTRPTVTFNKGLDLQTLSENSEADEQESHDVLTDLPSKTHPPLVFQEPQPAHFLEAHVIFEPLLSAIGVITQQVTGGALEQLGANVSVMASVEILRMDIIESEASKLDRKKRKTGLHAGKFFLDINGDVPSFICEKIGLEIDVRKVADESRSRVCQQPTLIVSRSALKQHTSTMIHFSLNVNYIAQQVNMPLLRLLHQISSMYQNARQTQIGLKEQRPKKSKNVSALKRHSKESFSELHEADFKAVEYSLSLSEEQGTLSSVGVVKGQRGSLVSSLSVRASSPSQGAMQHQGTLTRIGRPQSFAQKLKSSTKMSKGYMNLLEREKGASSPLLSHSVSGSGLEAGTLCSDKSPLLMAADQLPPTPPAVPPTPKCWRNIYYLVDLYATTPETKTVIQRTVVGGDISERYRTSVKYGHLKDSKHADVETGLPSAGASQETSILTDKIKDSIDAETVRTPLVMFGIAKIQKTKLLATLSGLKLEAEMNTVNSSMSFKERIKGGSIPRSTSEMSLRGHIGSTMIVLLEGIAPNQQTVVRVTVNESDGFYTSLSADVGKPTIASKQTNRHPSLLPKLIDKYKTSITIGPVQIDIPQHPVILHDMMTRGTKQLSSTLQELRVARPARLSRGTTIDEADTASSPRLPQTVTPEPVTMPTVSASLLHPIAVQFSIRLQEMSIHAALLPSLQATYCMQQVQSDGITGIQAKFSIHLPTHHLSFSTKIQDLPSDANLPPSATISLPQVHVEAEHIQDDSSCSEMDSAEGMILKEGSYLNAVAEIGALEHSLTTDLLNHLVFVQKVFMKEVNEVVQKMAGSDKPVPLWTEEGSTSVSNHIQRLLFSIQIKLKGIIITATTPTQSAVRLETGGLQLELSNRVQNVSKVVSSPGRHSHHSKIFGKAQVDITLALGQLIRNELFDEVEPELQQLAYFRTRICLRNSFQDELTSVGEEGEMVLISLTRPLICIQPLAVDRAVLVWLNYKNAYEYWNEQRATLNKEVLTATQQVFEKVPQFSTLSSATSIKNNIFLKLTVCDIGVCLPLNACRTISHQVDTTETKDALLVTLDSTIISACNSGSLVCKAHFKKFCTRFAPDFETSLDDWKPDLRDPNIMNLCMVSEGTYEVCSRTVAQNPEKVGNAKWWLNVQWQMEGVELHLDVNIGKHLSSLASTLTMLTGAPDVADVPSTDYDSEGDDNTDHTPQETALLPAFIFDPSMGARQRAKLLEIEMNEQAKTINDLKTLGASASTIETEMRRLKELEQIVSNDFRRDMLMKIRRQSIKATSMKDRLGLGPKLQLRSKSFKIPSPTVEVKEPVRHGSIASGSCEPLHYPPVDEVDVGEVFLTSSADLTLPLTSTRSETPTFSSSETEPDTTPSCNVSGDSLLKADLDTTRKRISSPQSPYGYGFPPGATQANTSATGFKQTDLSIDLELDVKVCINSGECILYNKDFTREEENKGKMKKERSFSGGIHDLPSSPGSVRKKSDMRNVSASKLKQSTQTTSFGIELTAFFIPGLDVKVHYESHNINEETPVSGGKGTAEVGSNACIPGASPLSPQYYSIPRTPKASHTKFYEGFTTATPSSIDSLATSPLAASRSPYKSQQSESAGTGTRRPTGLPSSFTSNIGGPSSGGSGRRVGTKRASLFTWLTLQSIPEETIISPSILDFMEKVLETISLPEPSKTELSSPVSTEPEMIYNMDMDSSLSGGAAGGGYSYASFPVDVIVYFHMQPSTIRFSCQPVSRVECLLKLPSLNVVFSSKRAEECGFLENEKMPSAMGGLSVTGALEDFSVFVFHPYGGKQRGSSSHPYNSLSESERKDSLSVMVEFVKFHIARSRKIHFKQENISAKSMKPNITSDNSKAIIRFSTIIDIGAALFKYDMRRLQEILAFPRAWYRRTIVRRLFLGDMTSRSMARGSDDVSPSASTGGKRHSISSADGNIDSSRLSGGNSTGMTPTGPPGFKMENSNWKKERMRLNSTDSDGGMHPTSRGPGHTLEKSGSWETLVQFAVNFTKLNVHMNIGNVMGNAVWTTKDFKADGRLSIGSTGHKNLYIGLSLGGSCLEARGGIVGGIIELAEINTYLKVREDPGMDPDHNMGLKLFASQSKLDYMGTSVLMGRVSSFSVTLKDDWELKQCAKDDEEYSTRRGATIFILGDLEWDQLQLLISKSTTADLLKMHHKLEEFFTAQFKSSKRVFSSLQQARNKSSVKSRERQRDANRKLLNGMNAGSDPRHHRHWHGILSRISGMHISTLPHPLPSTGTVLGGSLELHGKTIFLACFHGINFKSKSWALFSLRQPYINFTTEVQEVDGEVTRDTHIVQNLTFSLGLMEQNHAQHASMAKVCRITRNMVFPPQFRTIQEWFFYAFCTSDLDDVDRFPSLDASRTDSLNSTSSGESKRSSAKLQDHNHSSETIFAFPPMEIHLSTKHRQTPGAPDITDKKPVVECSFVTEFQDHIFVTVDAENFFFLHDLINSYVKDTKEKMPGTDVESKEGEKKAKMMQVNEPTQLLQQDWREFTCHTWHLEPTVRLLSWATRNLEPYGVDYILNKLGFSHARATIPKWLQRGCMDPLDKVLSVLLYRLITIHDHDAANK